MPSIDGGDSTSPEYAPHMYLGGQFIHNTEKIVQVGEWWYRGGRLDDETIVAERWKGDKIFRSKQTGREPVPSGKMPSELLEAMGSVSRSEQEAFQAAAEVQFGHPSTRFR